MFDIGFWELSLIGVIALLVVGPERLPALARNVGLWVGRIRRYVSHVKQDIEREVHADEMRQLLEKREGLSEFRDVARETASVLDDARKELDSATRDSKPSQPSKPAAASPSETQPFAPSSISTVSPSDGGAQQEREPTADAQPSPSDDGAQKERESTTGAQPSPSDDTAPAPPGSHDDQQPGRQGQR